MVTVGGIFYRKNFKGLQTVCRSKSLAQTTPIASGRSTWRPASLMCFYVVSLCLSLCVFFLLYKSLDRARFCWVKHYLGMQTRAMYSSSTSDAIWCSAMWLGGMRCNALSCTDTRSTYVTCKYLLFCKVHAFLHVVIV